VEAVENPSPSDSPSSLNFNQEFFSFRITGVAPGGPARVILTLHSGTVPTTYYRYGPLVPGPPEWYEFMFDIPTNTGAEINGNEITLDFMDGDRGDDDLAANGTIVDAGGPGSPAASTGGGGGGGGGGCFIATTSSGLFHMSAAPMAPYLALMLLLFVIGKATVQGRRKR